MVLITLRSILDLCLLMLTGFAAFRFKIIKKEGLNTMNGVLLNIALPATMLKSFQMDLLFEKKELLVSALGLSLLCQLLSIALPFILIRKGPDRNVERSAVAFSNNAFIAIPLLTSIYGDIGTFYASALNVISILFVFSVQPLMISGKFSAKDVARKTLNNKVIITLAAVALLIADIHLPRFIMTPVGYLGSLTTPLALLSIGAGIAQSEPSHMFNGRVVWISFLRLIVVPLIICFIFRLFSQDPTVLLCFYILASTPTGSLTPIYCEQEGIAADKASGIFLLTTIACVVTIPFIVFLMERI